MPIMLQRGSHKIQEESETRILNSIKQHPELFDSLNQIFTDGNYKQQVNYDELADEYNCTAEELKKVLQKLRQNAETKKSKDSTETRPRSTRSSLIEPRETRRSLRSQSIDKTISTASATAESTDNSCASSSCGSPKLESKRQRRTRKTLRAINEDDNIHLIADADASPADSTQQRPTTNEKAEEQQQRQEQQQQQQQKEDKVLLETRTNDSASSSSQEAASVSGSSPGDQRQPANDDNNDDDDDVDVERADCLTSSTDRYQEATTQCMGIKQMRSLRFSEPAQTPRNSPAIHSTLGNTARRVSIGTICKIPRQNNKEPNPDDPTCKFFESMGLTVMGFPRHLQAFVKVKVSNIVHELEYELTSPANGTGKPIVEGSSSHTSDLF